MRQLEGVTDPMNMSLSKCQEMVKDREDWHAAVHGVTRVRHERATKNRQQEATGRSEGGSLLLAVDGSQRPGLLLPLPGVSPGAWMPSPKSVQAGGREIAHALLGCASQHSSSDFFPV